MGLSYSWLHAYYLYLGLLRDLSSNSGAAYHGLKWPQDSATTAVAALYNLTLAINTDKKSKREFYPSPYPERNSTTKTGVGISKEHAKEIFKKMNSNLK